MDRTLLSLSIKVFEFDSLSLSLSLSHTHTHTRTHARTHAPTHPRTHARTHTHTHKHTNTHTKQQQQQNKQTKTKHKNNKIITLGLPQRRPEVLKSLRHFLMAEHQSKDITPSREERRILITSNRRGRVFLLKLSATGSSPRCKQL